MNIYRSNFVFRSLRFEEWMNGVCTNRGAYETDIIAEATSSDIRFFISDVGNFNLRNTSDVLYITGGEKDVLSLSSHGFHTICLNSETAKVPEDLLPSLQVRFNYIAILYDMDDTGRKESGNRVNELIEFGCPSVLNIELPLCGSKQEKDVSDFFRLGHTANELSDLTEEAIIAQLHRRLSR